MCAAAGSFRELYGLAKAKREAQPRHPARHRSGLRYVGPGTTASPDTWFTGVWTEVESDDEWRNIDAGQMWSQPRSPKSSKWNSMEADLLDHCESHVDVDSPLLPAQARNPSQRHGLNSGGRSLPRSAPTADGGRGGVEAGTVVAISALQPWLLAMRGRALGALAFPSERVWLRACLVGWFRLTAHNADVNLAGRCEGLVISSLADALESLRRFAASPSTSSVGVVLRLRHLHNMLSEEWAERIAAHGSDSESCDNTQANDIRMDGTSAVYFHRRLHRLLAHWPPDQSSDTARSYSPVQRYRRKEIEAAENASRTSSQSPRPGSRRKPRPVEAEELTSLKASMATEGCFQRLRGALVLVGGIWNTAFEKTEESTFRAAAKRALSVGFALDAVNLALPGEVRDSEEVTFTKWHFSRLEEVPPPLIEALQQLGPL